MPRRAAWVFKDGKSHVHDLSVSLYSLSPSQLPSWSQTPFLSSSCKISPLPLPEPLPLALPQGLLPGWHHRKAILLDARGSHPTSDSHGPQPGSPGCHAPLPGPHASLTHSSVSECCDTVENKIKSGNSNCNLVSTQTPNTPQSTMKELYKVLKESSMNKIAITLEQLHNKEQWELSPTPPECPYLYS